MPYCLRRMCGTFEASQGHGFVSVFSQASVRLCPLDILDGVMVLTGLNALPQI